MAESENNSRVSRSTNSKSSKNSRRSLATKTDLQDLSKEISDRLERMEQYFIFARGQGTTSARGPVGTSTEGEETVNGGAAMFIDPDLLEATDEKIKNRNSSERRASLDSRKTPVHPVFKSEKMNINQITLKKDFEDKLTLLEVGRYMNHLNRIQEYQEANDYRVEVN